MFIVQTNSPDINKIHMTELELYQQGDMFAQSVSTRVCSQAQQHLYVSVKAVKHLMKLSV